jgi:hypothetical protein
LVEERGGDLDHLGADAVAGDDRDASGFARCSGIGATYERGPRYHRVP